MLAAGQPGMTARAWTAPRAHRGVQFGHSGSTSRRSARRSRISSETSCTRHTPSGAAAYLAPSHCPPEMPSAQLFGVRPRTILLSRYLGGASERPSKVWMMGARRMEDSARARGLSFLLLNNSGRRKERKKQYDNHTFRPPLQSFISPHLPSWQHKAARAALRR